MIYPNFIKEKDTIGVTAPSNGQTDKLDLIRIDNAYKELKRYEEEQKAKQIQFEKRY